MTDLYNLQCKDLFVIVRPEVIGSDEWVFSYELMYLPEDKREEKRRCSHFKHKFSYSEGGGTYLGGFDTIKDAYKAAIKEGYYITENYK